MECGPERLPPIIPEVHNYHEFLFNCSQTSVHFLEQAIDKKGLPSRLTHVWISIKTACYEPFSVLGRISVLAVELLFLVPELLIIRRKENLFYRTCRIFFLTPLDIVVGVIASTTRLGSAILGLASPTRAAHG